jgi:phosphate transport system protein
MERHFERELQELKSDLVAMGSLVDEQLDRAYHALFSGDVEEAALVIARDRKVDAFDNRIDGECQRILALTQPVAIDLRLLMAALQINMQLERIGDIAVNIAKRTEPLVSFRDFLRHTRLPEMAQIARIMVGDSLNAFISGDPTLAERVLASDGVVDGLERGIFTDLVKRMRVQRDLVEPGAHMLMLSRHLERLADHATNIAEDVIFLVEAKMVKHNARDQAQDGLSG